MNLSEKLLENLVATKQMKSGDHVKSLNDAAKMINGVFQELGAQ